MNVRRSLLLCLLVLAAVSTSADVLIRNDSPETVDAWLDDIFAPAIEHKLLAPGATWNAPTSGTARYRLAFLQGAELLASTIITSAAKTATLVHSPVRWEIIVTKGTPSPEGVSATTPSNCITGRGVGYILGCRSFDSDDGHTYALSGELSKVPLFGQACICGVNVGQQEPCDLLETFQVTGVCPTAEEMKAASYPMIVRNMTNTPVSVHLQQPPAQVITTRNLPANTGSTIVPTRVGQQTVVNFFNGTQFLKGIVAVDMSAVALEQQPDGKYIIGIAFYEGPPHKRSSATAATPAAAVTPPDTQCWAGSTAGLIMGFRAFNSGNETYYLEGNLVNVPVIGPTCLCGVEKPPNPNLPLPYPIIAVEHLCHPRQ